MLTLRNGEKFETDIDGVHVVVESIERMSLRAWTNGEIEDDELITTDCAFTVSKDGKKYGVEAYQVQGDSDMYNVSIYNNTTDEKRDTMTCTETTYYDSCGGTTEDLYVDDDSKIKAVILTVLFGYNTGLIIPF